MPGTGGRPVCASTPAPSRTTPRALRMGKPLAHAAPTLCIITNRLSMLPARRHAKECMALWVATVAGRADSEAG